MWRWGKFCKWQIIRRAYRLSVWNAPRGLSQATRTAGGHDCILWEKTHVLPILFGGECCLDPCCLARREGHGKVWLLKKRKKCLRNSFCANCEDVENRGRILFSLHNKRCRLLNKQTTSSLAFKVNKIYQTKILLKKTKK